MVADFEIESCQIAKLWAAQVKPSLLCEITFTDPGQFNQGATKGLPACQRSSRKKAGEDLC